MDSLSWPDILRAIISIVGTTIPDIWVADRVPSVEEFSDNLPAVVIDLLPASETSGWGPEGPLMDHMPLDVDVFAHSRAEAFDVSTKLRKVFHSLVTMGALPIVHVEAPMFTARPDYNPHIRRLGCVINVTSRA